MKGNAYSMKNMASFRKARDALVVAYDSSLIDEEEFLALYDSCYSGNPELPFYEYPSFAFEEVNDEESCVDFRFKKNEILALARVLNLPEKFTCDQGTVCESIKALCIVLRRFAYPCRFSDLVPQFGRPVPELSMITNTVVDFIFQNHGEKLTTWNHALLNPQSLRLYADAIHQKGAALENCFGFVDGTVRRICRPGQMQRIVYNGHKRVHALKFQSVVLPNGIIANMFGPIGMQFFTFILNYYDYYVNFSG